MEAHEGVAQAVGELTLDIRRVEVRGDRVVDVEQGDRLAGDAGADVFAHRAIDIHLAGHGVSLGSHAAVDVAGLEPELLGERGPALVGKYDILARAAVLLGPIEQGELKLRHAGQQVRIAVAAGAQLGGHVLHHSGNARVAMMGLVGHQQIQLGVLLDFDAQVIEALDGRVAGEEILWARPEGDHLEGGKPDERPRHRDEVLEHPRDVLGGAHRILRDDRLEAAQPQVVGAVEHAAVGVASAVDEVVAGLLRSRSVHDRAVEVFGEQGLGGFGAEVAQVDEQRVAASALHVCDRLEHIVFVFHHGGALIDFAATRGISLHNRPAAALGQGDNEAVAADRDDAKFYFGNVVHDMFTPIRL